MRALPFQNRSTAMWLLVGVGVIFWAALSMLLSGSPASASQAPATHVAASAPTSTKAAAGQGHPGQGHGQQKANRGNGGTNPGHRANRGHQTPAPAPSSAVQPARNIAVKSAQAVPVPAPAAQKPGKGDVGADARNTAAPKSMNALKAVKAAPQRFAEEAGADVDRNHRAGVGDSHREDRGWHGQHQMHTQPLAHKTAQANKVSHTTPRTTFAVATTVTQPPSAAPQPSPAAQAPVQPPAPVPAQHTSSHPLSTAAQSSGAGSILALEASAAAMPPTPSGLHSEQALHPDEVPPAGPVDSTESFPD